MRREKHVPIRRKSLKFIQLLPSCLKTSVSSKVGTMRASQTKRSSFAHRRCLCCSSSSRRTSSTQPRNPQGSLAASLKTSRATRRVSVTGSNTFVQCRVLVFARAKQPSSSRTSCWHAHSSQASALRYGSARQRSQKSSSTQWIKEIHEIPRQKKLNPNLE